MEPLELRALMATFTVDSVLDTVAPDGVTTLREAIELSNATPLGVGETHHVIDFAIVNPPGTVKTIAVQGTPLPSITRPVLLDGYTQSGSSANTLATGDDAVLAIAIDGAAAGSADGLVINAAGTTVRGLAIGGFAGTGIVVNGATVTGVVVAGNFIGLNPDGTAHPNARNGVLINGGASASTVGGASPADRNVISSNVDDGLEISGGASGNAALNNYIGTNPAGVAQRPNEGNGVRIDDADGNTVGAGNLISGNALDGVLIRNGATGNVVTGNLVGTDASGTSAVPNGDDGLNIASAPANTVGPGNVFSGNTSNGVVISGASATGNVVLGNRIGTNAAGSLPLPNQKDGVIIATGAGSNTVGGVNAVAGVLSAGNLISGNAGVGVRLNSVTGNAVLGNFIGTDLAGAASRPNGAQGILLSAATGTTVGGTNSASDALTAGNLVSSNTSEGILISGAAATGNLLVGNFVGTNATGTGPLANGLSGIGLAGAAGNTVGGPAAGQRNVVSGNFAFGIELAGATGSLITGNYIGTNASGTAAIGNRRSGVRLTAASGNSIGGTNATAWALDAGNLISGNAEEGVRAIGGSSNNLLAGNFIGTNAAGSSAVINGLDGVAFSDATDNSIGGGTAASGNLISGNESDGIDLTSGATGTLIRANRIGTTADGTAAIANVDNGVRINGADGNTVGGANLISGNRLDGLLINGGSASNVVTGNLVGTNAGGTSAVPNGDDGLNIASAPNNTVGPGNVFSGNVSNGVVISGASASGTVVLGNRIGTNAIGNTAIPNQKDGVIVATGAAGSVIGGTDAASRNVISGNLGYGVRVAANAGTGQLIVGNSIGADRPGNLAIPNTLGGVWLGTADNTVGGSAAGAGNIISGNAAAGVVVASGGSRAVLLGNSVGLSGSGTASLGNAGEGVRVEAGASGVTVGGPAEGEGNVISGNAGAGLRLLGASANVRGNFIGTDLSGAAAVPNTGDGLRVEGPAGGHTLGGTTVGEPNVISGNGGNGIYLGGSFGNLIAGNLVGVSATGSSPLPNAGSGLLLDNSGANRVDGNIFSANGGFGLLLAGSGAKENLITGNIVGGDASGSVGRGNTLSGITLLGATGNTLGAGNVVIANGGDGIQLLSGSTLNLIESSFVGVTATGLGGIGNTRNGLLIAASFNTVGGNVISGNGSNGIDLEGADATVIQSNFIGTNQDGTSARPNVGSGVLQVGGMSTWLAENVLSGNRGFGLVMAGGASTATVRNNRIGTDAAGTAEVGNGLHGLMLIASTSNTVSGNVVSGNLINGIELRSGSNSNTIDGNRIGTDINGARAFGNHGDGLLIDASTGNTVTANVLSGNVLSGLHLAGGTSGTLMAGNLIGTNAAGDAAVSNLGHGAILEGASFNTLTGGVVSANIGFGVAIISGANRNLVAGVRIGTDASGVKALGNASSGFFVLNAAGNTLRNSQVSANAVDSGSGNVRIEGAASTGNALQGNLIGTDVTGTSSLDPDVGTVRIDPGSRPVSGLFIGNERVALDGRTDGVVILGGASSNTVGGSDASARNLISGNRIGVFIRGASPSNVVAGNYLGTTASGGAMAEAQRQQQGVVVLNSSFNTIGGVTATERNIISGQLETGIRLTRQDIDENGDGTPEEPRSDTSANVLAGNYIGTNPDGNTAVPNFQGVYVYGAANNFIGLGTYDQQAGGNVISGNINGGVQILNAATANARTINGQIVVNPLAEGAVTSGNLIQGNRVGTSADGLSRVANGGTGIFINDAPSNIALSNLVSGNAMTGITVFAPEATANRLESNRVGTAVDGSVVPSLANGWMYSGDRAGAKRGPGVFLNQVVSGSTVLVNNDLRGNTGGEKVEYAIRKGPSVQSVTPVVNSTTGLITTIEIVFNGYLERSSRTLDPSNYRLIRPSGTSIPLANAPTYDEAGRRITLTLATPLSTTDRYQLTVVGTPKNGLKSRPGLTVPTAGAFLDGSYLGRPGTDATFEFVGTTRVARSFFTSARSAALARTK